jgi:integrase
MKQSKKRIQKGSLRQVSRARGKWAWEWRYVDPKSGLYESRFFSAAKFPTKSKIEVHIKPFVGRLNAADIDYVVVDPTMGDLLDRFIADENLLGIKERKPGERATDKDELAYSTATSYLSLCNCIREKWGETKLDNFKPLAFQQWLKSVDKKPKTKGHLKAFVHRLFNKAKLYEMLNFVENPIKLVEVRGISKRQKRQVDLTIEQCFLLFGLLPEPYRMMAFFALCTGLRIEEILALYWKKIDCLRLCMKVEEAVVHGRIGPVKTEYSEDELPLDPKTASILLDWKRASNAGDVGLVFPSHITGRCYHASPLQQDWIRRAGWCLVTCPECGAGPGARCKDIKPTRHKRQRIPIHVGRREAATEAEFGSIGWHTFRHKYRTLLSESGTPLEVQQKLLRHADIRTTTLYGGVPMENKRAANSMVVREILIRKSSR